jgi:hypothetical protein
MPLREYPKGLGKALLKLVKENRLHDQPMPCLRQKKHIPEETARNDLKLFESLEMGDTWSDAKLADVYMSLWKNKKLRLPSSWRSTMVQLTKDLKAVPGFNWI